MHTSKRMHFIEENGSRTIPPGGQVLHTSKRMHFIEEKSISAMGLQVSRLHTSKRMHFIEEARVPAAHRHTGILHTSKRMHFIEDGVSRRCRRCRRSCIRQNVCTSLRKVVWNEDNISRNSCIRQNVCTSLRTCKTCSSKGRTANLHTSKRMHFIEDGLPPSVSV